MDSALPQYLPVCTISRRPADDSSWRLVGLILERLAGHGVSGVVIGGDRLSGLHERTCRAAGEADLVFIDSTHSAGTARLSVGRDDLPTGPDIGATVSFSCADGDGVEHCVTALLEWLERCCAGTPVHGAVLIGGKSRRMGSPKHLLTGAGGKTWLETAVEHLTPFADDYAVVGAGSLPAPCLGIRRIDDLPGLSGPLAGVGAAVASLPWVSWLVVACDMPDISAAAVEWLLSQRRPGVVAIIPANPLTGRGEPLLAWYDFRSASLLERLQRSGSRRLNDLTGPRVLRPRIPDCLVGAWRNVNRPEERT